MNRIPRILIAAPHSGAGKTTVTLAVLSALKKRGLNPVSFKCGPDYIDPMFHRAVLGIPSFNLDLFFTPPETVCGLMGAHAESADIAVVEGVMGYYDGSGDSAEASSYAIAAATDTPTILVVPSHGAYLSLAATIQGFASFRDDSHIAGVILNDCSRPLFDKLKPMLERETGLPMLGFLPRRADCSIGSRHLGLVTADEIGDLATRLDRLGDEALESIDFDRLLAIAGGAPPLTGQLPDIQPVTDTRPRIAVARDDAFCFYYEDNLLLLERLGAALLPFSPLHDAALPDDASALYLGGGYPELYASALSANTPMLHSIRDAVIGGMPTFAECGGYMMLHASLEDNTGTAYPMVGALPGQAFKTDKLQRFGYVNLTAQTDTMMCRAGETIRGHEFHFWDTADTGSACTATRTSGTRWPCVHGSKSLFAGFPHLYFYSNPHFAESLVNAAATYAAQRTN